MPFLAMAIILIWGRLRPGKEGPIRPGGLLLACFLGTLSHPALDFLNTYGTRIAEPLNHR
jgi:inner membrane protein